MTIRDGLEWEILEPGKAVRGDATLTVSGQRNDLDGRAQVSLVIGHEEFVHDSFPRIGEVRVTVEAIVKARNLTPIPEHVLKELMKFAA